jgi:hypothetical protein
MLNCTDHFRAQVINLQQAVAAAERERKLAEQADPASACLKAGRTRSRAIAVANRARIVEWVRTHPRCNTIDIANGIDLTVRNTRNHIVALVAEGRLTNSGSRRRAAYVVSAR